MTNRKDHEGAAKALKARLADRDFLAKNTARLRTDFPDCFVAIHHAQVVASGSDQEQTVRAIRAKGIDPRTVLFTFLHAPDTGRVMGHY